MNLDASIVPWRGVVTDIHIATTGGAQMVATEQVNAVVGRGLEGDRYFSETGFYSWFGGPIRHVSLIEWEVLERLRLDHDLPLEPVATRRNIVTRGVPLGHLIGRRFRVGGATLRGVEICEPCGHLVELTSNRPLLSALIHRGGLHAEIVTGGMIQLGDMIEAVDPASDLDEIVVARRQKQPS
jgi:MOSC domain-containing protein YiiM